MNDWRNNMGLDAFDNIRKMQEQIQASVNPLLKHQQMMADIMKGSGFLKAQEKIAKSFSGINMMAEITKSMQHHRLFVNPTLSAIEAITKSMSFQAKFAIPQTTIDTITSINRQDDQLFRNLRSITEVISKNHSAFSQINSWQFAISGISGQLASIAASQQKWNLIDDFEEITEEAVLLNEKIYDGNGVSKEGLIELKEFFQRIEIKVDKIDADANALFWKLLTLISIILAFTGEIRNWLPKPEYATKQEVETIINDQFKLYESKLKEEKELRITKRACKVLIKPKMKSIIIEKLPCGFEIVVLQVNHKWVYVSYFSPKDNLPQTGWIMKKYLNITK
ncbi:hypothetical protein [Paludibacter sp.]|uniref:hypothetical protein n=1 Tax=Paludibacter sp. TaxID=1898105 RepID=UPI0013552A97|nr:hypothetical protein [Paludibacter sp.]MTK53662.1 hypothetical protein [Paludibacter sp.]